MNSLCTVLGSRQVISFFLWASQELNGTLPVDLHYWGTENEEWYDPKQITTKDGDLVITLQEAPDISINHNLTLIGGMMSVRPWSRKKGKC